MSNKCVRLYMLLPPEFPPSLRTMRDAQALGGIFEGPFQAGGANLVVHAVCLASLLAFLAKNGVGHRHDNGGRNQQYNRPNGYRQYRSPFDAFHATITKTRAIRAGSAWTQSIRRFTVAAPTTPAM